MRRPSPSVNFKTVDHLAGKKLNKDQRLAYLDYEEVISYLKEIQKIPLHDKSRPKIIDIMGYKVSITGLKLRTFIHYAENNKDCCANPNCDLKPKYFALEAPHSNKRENYSVAYLSLYGLDNDNNEIEFTHDHTLARCFGGANVISNTTMMCFPCNNRKSRIESRIHHRTLKVLKEFLEDTTGEFANPQYILERVRNSDLNFDTEERKLERVGILGVEEVMKAIKDPIKKSNTWFDKKIKTSGVRLETFANGQACCANPDCEIKADYFAVERIVEDNKTFYSNHGYHLNMYAKNKDGKEIQFMHHHMMENGIDGIPENFTIVTLCEDCKKQTLNEDHDQIEQIISNLGGGVTQQQFEINKKYNIGYSFSRNEMEKIEQSKRTEKISAAASKLAKNRNISVTEYIQLCNQNAIDEEIPNNLNARHNGVRRVIQTLQGITPAGARWFRKEQREVFSQENLVVNKNKLSNEEIYNNTSVNKTRSNKIKKYCNLLAYYYDMTDEEYLNKCKIDGNKLNMDDTLEEGMNNLRSVCSVLKINPAAARIFNRECGHILKIGPERPSGQAQIKNEDLMNYVKSLKESNEEFNIVNYDFESVKMKRADKKWKQLKKWFEFNDEQLIQFCKEKADRENISNEKASQGSILYEVCKKLNMEEKYCRAFLMAYEDQVSKKELIKKELRNFKN